MSYTLKTTGLAAIATSIIAVDEDGTTIRDFVSSARTSAFTVDAAVTTGTSSWKGTARNYFQTLSAPGDSFKGITIGSGQEIPINCGVGHTGIGVFIACAGAGAPGFYGVIMAQGTGPIIRTSGGKLRQPTGESAQAGTTTIPSDGTTKFAMGISFLYGSTWTNYYGLESGSLAADGTGTDAGNGGDTLINSIGGASGFGSLPAKYHIMVVIPRPMTLAEEQSLHNDWFGTLFDVVTDTTAPTLTSPTGTKTGSTTASGTVSTDEANGTLRALAIKASATAPSVAQVKVGTDGSGVAADYVGSTTVTATGVQNFSATGLAASTAYKWYYQQTDAAATPNDSTVSASASFTTDAAGGAVPGFDLSVSPDHVFTREDGPVLASKAVTLWVHHPTTGALVASITGATNASGLAGSVTHAALTASTAYRVNYEFATGEYGVIKMSTAA